MKTFIVKLLEQSVNTLKQSGSMQQFDPALIAVERTRDPAHGDFASNIAMRGCRQEGVSPKQLAARIVHHLPPSDHIAKVEIAGPGFINFTLSPTVYFDEVATIRARGSEYGTTDSGRGQRVMVEFVSTNPTGPLHVGHGRGAAYGDALARVLRAAGYDTHSEYYINDAGRQMDILAVSVWLRYLELSGQTVAFPANGYKGDYIRTTAQSLMDAHGKRLVAVLDCMVEEDAEVAMDQLIAQAKSKLGDADYQLVHDHANNAMLDDIRQDLAEFGVEFQCWFSERSLMDNGDIAAALEVLEQKGYIYVNNDARWFKTTAFGDQKDRVVVRANGAYTYFASDIAYHYNKARRGFDRIINIFGADHHGYVSRIQASFAALGNDPERLQFLMVQFAVLYRDNVKVSMSTRGGQFIPLRELRAEVGNDACRFFYVLRRPDQHLDFDLDLAKRQAADNPVYYIQYAHARICSIFRQVEERGLATPDTATPDYRLLGEARETDLMRLLSRFPEVIELAAAHYEPHQLAFYLQELAHCFHGYYNAHPFLASEDSLRLARLGLLDATRIVIANGLTILGVSAPQRM